MTSVAVVVPTIREECAQRFLAEHLKKIGG